MFSESKPTKERSATTFDENGREARRLAALDHLGAVRPEADRVLQELVDEVRNIFETDLCMVNLILSDVQYFRAWSGELPEDLAETRQDPRERSMCHYVVETEKPLVMPDFLATAEFKDQYFCVNYGIRFYAGVPLITSGGNIIGTLCLLNTRPKEMSEEQMTLLSAFARAVVGRLELLGALGRERAAREDEAQRSQDIVEILESITDAFFALDSEWCFAYLNSEAERFLGRAREELIGKNFWEEYPRTVDSAFYREFQRAMSEQVKVEFEEHYPAPLGIWMETHAYPSEQRLSVYSQDITERKRAEEALKESEEFIRQLLRNFPNGSVNVFDKDLRYLLAEGQELEQVGLSSEMLVGKTLDELFPKESVDFVRPYYERAFVGEAVQFELSMGDYIYSINCAPLHEEDDKVRTIIAVAQNVTERKRAEEKLYLRDRAIAASSNGIIITDPNQPDNPVVYVNPGFERITGYAAEELTGRNCRLLQGNDRDQPALDELREAIREERQCQVVLRNYRKDGTLFWNELYLSPVYDEDGKLTNFVGVQNDITERMQLEANQQRFLANAAHQLRTPITAVVGAAELLETKKDATPAVRHRLLNHILSEGRRMQQLAGTLLRLARAGRDLREPSLELVDLSEAAQQAVERMEPLAANEGIMLRAEGKGALVHADPEWLQEMMLILLSNAIKHSERGTNIWVRASGGTIAVEDEGAGISPDDLPYVFERFYRGKGSSDGFGLGLSICRELTKRMRGSISIGSREGVGTAIKVELPEADVDA